MKQVKLRKTNAISSATGEELLIGKEQDTAVMKRQMRKLGRGTLSEEEEARAK